MAFISETLAQFVHQLRYEDIPAPVRERAKDLMLDAIGIAFASTKFEFADKALAGLQFFGGGMRSVIGMSAKLALRDAVVMNGVLSPPDNGGVFIVPQSVTVSSSRGGAA